MFFNKLILKPLNSITIVTGRYILTTLMQVLRRNLKNGLLRHRLRHHQLGGDNLQR